MFWFKGCPRCSGDLYKDHDQYGTFVSCVQCGFSKDVATQGDNLLVISADPVPAPAVPPSDGGKRRRLSHGGRHFGKTLSASEKYAA